MLERSRFSLDNLPKAEQFDVWKESVNCIYNVNTDRKIREEGFAADLNSWRYNDLLMIEARSIFQTFSRTPQMIAEDGIDHYNIQIYPNGSIHSDAGVGGNTADGGDILLLDLSQPTEAQSSDSFKSLNLYLPRRIVEDKLIHPEDHNLRFLSKRDPLVKILYNQILSMHRHIDQLDKIQIGTLQETTSILLATCLNAAQRETTSTQALRQDFEKIVKVRRYFGDNLLSPDLTVTKAATDLGLSRSNLYNLFRHHGGVNQYIRNMRLKHSLKLLSDPKQQPRSIYDIALECGYESDTGFIRAFRAKYDMTPGDVRAGHLPRRAGQPGAALDKRYENWLQTLA